MAGMTLLADAREAGFTLCQEGGELVLRVGLVHVAPAAPPLLGGRGR